MRLCSQYLNFSLQAHEDTPITAGIEGVTGRMNSHTVKLSFNRTERLEIASSSIMSKGPLSEKKSENDGDRRTLLKDEVADFTLST
nr:hypothetical protein Itr_chr01CG21140 [Ipomoea trifida]